MPRNEYKTFQQCTLIIDGEVCYGTMKVIDSRPQATHLRRRRRCLKCGDAYTTYEITADQMDALGKGNEKIREFRKAFREVLEGFDA